MRETAVRVLEGVVGWLSAQLGWFDPAVWERRLPRRPFRPGPLLELLGLLRLLDRVPGLSVPAYSELRAGALDLAERIVDEPGFVTGLRRADPYFPYHLNLVALLELLGRPRPELRRDCRALLAVGAGGHTRPHRPVASRLELRCFLDRCGLPAPPDLPDRTSLYRQSLPGLGADPLTLDESEVYAFTHALFYATDFGARPLPPDVPLPRDTVHVLLAAQLALGHLDLVAELLVCAELTGDPDGRLRSAGWAALARSQRPDGAVPGPVHRPALLTGPTTLTGEKATAYLFGTCYHTTLATGLAAAARLGSGAEGAGDPGRGPTAEGGWRHGTADVDAFSRRGVGGSRQPAAQPPANGRADGIPRRTAPPSPPDAGDADAVRRWADAVRCVVGEASDGEQAEWIARVEPLLVVCAWRRDRAGLAAVLAVAHALGRGDTALARSAAALLAAGWCDSHEAGPDGYTGGPTGTDRTSGGTR
ncbi:hypothetical protein RKD49_001048 [Streptomyces glaucescens]